MYLIQSNWHTHRSSIFVTFLSYYLSVCLMSVWSVNSMPSNRFLPTSYSTPLEHIC